MAKTITEMINASVKVPTKLVDGCMLYQHSMDEDVMGITVFNKEVDGKIFLFKDAEFTKPVMDYELLSIFFGNTRMFVVDSDGGIELSSANFEETTLNTYEYKHGRYVKDFYEVDGFYSGQTYVELLKQAEVEAEEGGEESGSAVVGTAIVGQDVVAPSEEPQETIWLL